jgi:hypothetical protein
MEFLIEEPIEGDCEPGYDGWQVNGQYSEYCGVGYEVKDEGIIEKVYKDKDLPKVIKDVNEKMSPIFKELGYNGDYSTELRIDKKGKVYYNDATCRKGSPPSEVMSELFANPGQMLWDIAENRLPTMKPQAKFGAQLQMHSDWLKKNWLPISCPKEVRPWLKLRNNCIIKGVEYCVPQDGIGSIGAITAIGDTIDEATELCLERAKQVKAYLIAYEPSTFDKAHEYLKTGERHGISFT